MALYPTWQPQARDFGSTTTTSDNTVLTWHSRYEISLVEVILVLNFKILKLTDYYMQLLDVVALYPTWQPQARDFGSTTTTSDNTVLTWHSRYEISLVEVILVLNFKLLKLTDNYMQKSGQTIGFGVPPPGRWLGAARPPNLSLTGQSGCTSWRHQTSIDPSSGFGHRNSLPVLPLRLPQCGNYGPCISWGPYRRQWRSHWAGLAPGHVRMPSHQHVRTVGPGWDL